MQVKPFLCNCLLLCQSRLICSRGRSVKRVRDQRRNRAEIESREIQQARRQDLWLPRRKPRVATAAVLEPRHQRTDIEVLETASPLMELESWLLGPCFDGWDCSFGWRVCRFRALFGGFRGACEHLNYLLEGRGVCLDEGRWAGVDFGSCDGLVGQRHSSSIAAAATTAGVISLYSKIWAVFH